MLDAEPTFADRAAPPSEIPGVRHFGSIVVAGRTSQLGAELADYVEHAIAAAAIIELQ